MVESRYPLDDDMSTTITLPDGRKLGYARYGCETGPTIICLHGLPGSRFDFARSDSAAKAVGVRIVSIDRPGIGLSSPHVEGTLLSFAKDVEALTDALALESYAVLGGSAGGPYSLACAYSLPVNKLKAVAVICGLGAPDMDQDGISWISRIGRKYAYYVPSMVLRWFWSRDPGANVHLSPEQHLELLRSHAAKSTPHEREVGLFDNEDSLQLWLKTSREAFKRGVDGPVQDTYRLVSDWGFRIEDIRSNLPVLLWYGNFDTIAPIDHGRQYAVKLGTNARLTIKDETHGSMFETQKQAYLKELVDCMSVAL